MSISIPNYDYGFKIVSLAKDNDTKEDLLSDNVEFIFCDSDKIYLYPEGLIFTITEELYSKLGNYNNYDVFELWTDGTLYRCYDNSSVDNYFFVTGKCNSNCIMCPSHDFSRQHGDEVNIDKLIEISSHIPVSTRHLTITGGEPFMARKKIFELLHYVNFKFTNTEFLILTNGRIFAVEEYVECLRECINDRTIIGIPLHGSCAQKHDYITRADGSFSQTVLGIKRLLSHGIRVELRLVVCNLNVNDYLDMARLIIDEMPGVEYVSVMAAEMTGNAFANRESVWRPYGESFSIIKDSIELLINSGIDVKLYNFPLCTVDMKYWTLCEKSISPNKVTFADICEDCKYKGACGGVFSGSFNLEKDELKPIK